MMRTEVCVRSFLFREIGSVFVYSEVVGVHRSQIETSSDGRGHYLKLGLLLIYC